MGVPWGQSVRFGRRKNFWRWTVVMFTQPREHMYLKMVQVVTVCYAYLTTILTKRASLESLGREFPASLPVTRKRNQLLRRRNKRLGPRRPQQGGRDLVRPVSEARPRESPRPQDPVRLTPHEAQDKHTKHPAPRGPRRGGPRRRPPPYTSAPSAAASLAASFPRFCERPAGGAGAEQKGRRDRRKAGHPEPALRGRRPPRGRLKPSGSPRPRSSGPPASLAPPAPGAASANAGQSPRRVWETP